MTNDEFIGYCEIHCTTERALFSGTHVNRMLDLAGFPPGFEKQVEASNWFSVHEEMAELCKHAKTTALHAGLEKP
jgi:hypothetical protein